MKNLIFTILIFLVGVLQVQSQNGYKNSEEHKASKQNLIDEVRGNFTSSINSNTSFKQSNLKSGIKDYGDAPSWNWAEQFGGTTADSATGHVVGMDTDQSGNFYTYGYASSEMDYFGEVIQKGTFLSKQNPTGEINWLKQLEDIEVDYGLGNYITIDPSNENIYITGIFYETFIIPGGPVLIPEENGSIFIIKFGIDGTYISSIQEDIPDAHILCLAADYSGNILLSGTFSGEVNIGSVQLVCSGVEDAFIAKYNSTNNLIWAIKAGGIYQEYLGLISVDDNDNIYFTGEFWSVNVEIGNTSFTMNEGEGNIVFAKLFPNGTVDWVTSKAASTANQGGGDSHCWPTGIITNTQGYTYIKGWHGDSTYFDNELLRSPYYDYSYFIAKFDNNGNTMWANSIHEHYYGNDYNQFDCDSEGNVYLGAQATDTLHFGDDFEYVNVGECDLFVAKYLTTGELDWVKTMESTTGYNRLSSVAVCDTNLYIGGHFSDYIKFDDEVKLSDIQHGFIAMSSKNSLGFSNVFSKTNFSLNIYPNPLSLKTTIKFTNPSLSIYKLAIYNISGEKVYQQDNIKTDKIKFKKGNLTQGVYIVELKGEKVYRGKMVVR